MEYLLKLRAMNYWLAEVKCHHTYHATNITRICSADAGISAQRNVPSRRCTGVIFIYIKICQYTMCCHGDAPVLL